MDKKYSYREGFIPVENIHWDETLRMHIEKNRRKKTSGDDADTILDESLEEYGMMDSIKVRAMKKDSYLLLDGWKRLRKHKQMFPGKPIRCTIKESEGVRSGGLETEVTEQDLCDAATYNLAREKVPAHIVEGIVSKLHAKSWGYERIAKAIGYSKSGVQKIIKRLESGNTDNPEGSSSQVSIKEIRRTRTILKKVAEMFKKNLPKDVSDAVDTVDAFLQKQEESSQQATAPSDSVDRVDNNDTAQDVDTANQAEATDFSCQESQ